MKTYEFKRKKRRYNFKRKKQRAIKQDTTLDLNDVYQKRVDCLKENFPEFTRHELEHALRQAIYHAYKTKSIINLFYIDLFQEVVKYLDFNSLYATINPAPRDNSFKLVSLKQQINALSDDALLCIMVVISPIHCNIAITQETTELTEITIDYVKRYLSSIGWNKYRILLAIFEIKQALKRI